MSRKPERPYISSLKSSPMGPRRRTLRTYGKRVLSMESTEPPSKRQRLSGSSVTSIEDKGIDSISSGPEESATGSSLRSSPIPTRKGTITAYFGKIIPQLPRVSPSSEPSPDPVSEPNELTSTSPSSPPIATTTRTRGARRLKTRIIRRRVDEEESLDKGQGNQDGEERVDNIRSTGLFTNKGAPMLSEATPSALNRSQGITRDGPEGKKPRESRRRENRTASVQTTLSLSTRETHYTECKECGMLYNHLHETDVKYHARRHASLRRAKTRASSRSDAVDTS
ncbi:hypothetical protein F5B22DRAFT_385698 [Xylaria bambusicola]|uniref:uncharacterized protein n=1 Tax=Xylaria bambusicola TaxID=326684 RepID=UPI002008E3A5|nr:uncharacterized protein F5B22DRAFT_385698 [Xylaria bambusicola]KAI0508821.1 hypothetical protein F5B22DRAFT_385698 [Xylaria bambusicola]